jgi:hypothetical protein
MGSRHVRTQMPGSEEVRFLDITLSPLEKALDFLVFIWRSADDDVPHQKNHNNNPQESVSPPCPRFI